MVGMLFTHLLHGVTCATHSLKLDVEDTLEKVNVSATNDDARRFVIKLQTPNMLFVIDILLLTPELLLTDDELSVIVELTEALSPARITTKILLSKHLTLGVFYGLWLIG